MINELKNEIKKQLNKEYRYVTENQIDNNLIYVLILKYYCETNQLSYEELLKTDDIQEIELPDEFYTRLEKGIKYNKLVSIIRYENLKDLVIEYLNDTTIGVNIINNSNNKICIAKRLIKSLYDINGNTSYVIDKFILGRNEISKFMFYDKVLENNNKYIKYEEIPYKENNYIYIYDNTPKYRFIKDSDNDIYPLIKELLYKNNNKLIILHTDYKKISNLKQSKMIINYMSKVLLDDETAYIYYENKDNNKVSIINYDKEKIKNFDKLLHIINTDRKQKDILVKTTIDEIIANHYRIGFRLYQNNTIEDVRNINEIVDENTKLINKLTEINKNIEQEINKLINR